MIELESVSKIYHKGTDEVRALDDLSLSIEQGEFVAIRGPSGSGKSTLLSLIGGLALPTGGKVRVAGEVVSQMTAAERASFRAQWIGFVFQLFHLLPYLNIVENVLIAAPPTADRQAAGSKARQLLEEFGLSGRLKHRPSELSAGERQRVAMARALLNDPKLLLADEPTGNLDAESAGALIELLQRFHGGDGTIVLVTHDESVASPAQRSITLRNGRSNGS
jgi:ABC-type lipoprotein export system ATPase subunit